MYVFFSLYIKNENMHNLSTYLFYLTNKVAEYKVFVYKIKLSFLLEYHKINNFVCVFVYNFLLV